MLFWLAVLTINHSDQPAYIILDLISLLSAKIDFFTVKPVLSGHSKKTKNWFSIPIIA